jgi:hypothetical protein
MPRATTSQETERFELASAPPDGFVVLRKMSYGDYLRRRDMAMKMGISGFRKGSTDEKIDIDMIQEEVTRFEFKTCIVDHNLTDENDRKLTLSEPYDFNQLDSKIGDEISTLIDTFIKFDEPKSGGEPTSGSETGDPVPGHSESDG